MALVLLLVLFLGILAGGLRSPADWALAGSLFWLAALASPQRPSWQTMRPWLLFVSWLAVCALASDQSLKSLPVLSRWAAAAVWLGLAATLWQEREKQYWFWGLALIAAILAAASLYGGMTNPSWGNRSDRPELMSGLLRPYYNYTIFVLVGACAAAAAVLAHKQGPHRALRLLAPLLVLSALAFYFTRARGGAIALCGGAALALIRQGHGRKLLVAAMGVVLAALLFKGTSLWLMKLDKSAVFKRPQIWKAAFQAVREHPLAGLGPGNFEQGFRLHNFPSNYRVTNYQFSTPYAHSEPLHVAAEAGVPGLALLLAALAAGLRVPRRRVMSWEKEAALAAFVAMSLHLLVDNMLQLPALCLLYLAPLAVLREDQEPASSPSRAWAWLCGTGLVFAAASWAPERLSAFYERNGFMATDPRRRVEFAWRAMRVFPAEPGLREGLARAWLAAQPPNPEQALRELERASALSPFNAIYLVMRAEILRQNGQWEQIQALAERAEALEPNCLQARLLRAEALIRARRRPEAIAELAEVRKRREKLKSVDFYVPDRSRYTGFDLTIGAFDAGRFAAIERLAYD